MFVVAADFVTSVLCVDVAADVVTSVLCCFCCRRCDKCSVFVVADVVTDGRTAGRGGDAAAERVRDAPRADRDAQRLGAAAPAELGQACAVRGRQGQGHVQVSG